MKINTLPQQTRSLGNNELEIGSKELSPFLYNIETTILASNIILREEKEQKLQKSVIFDIKGVKVGLVGYLTPDVNILDTTGDIEYIDEVIALKEEVAKLQEQNVKIIIALGHADINKEKEIAREVEGLDLVIGGRRNIFSWKGTTTDEELASTDMSIVITQRSGRKVPVVQSYAYDKFLGKIYASFDVDGEITAHTAEPILLDSSIPQEPLALEIVKKYNKEIASRSDEIIGETAVVLDGDTCRLAECNLGNLITDAIMYYYALRHEGDPWSDAPIAIIPGGNIAASISPANRPAAVTRQHLLTALPTESHIATVTMNGTVLLQLLEHSISWYTIENSTGQLLQVSGIRAVFDLERESGSRLVSAVVRCGSCYVPEFYVIDDWRTYKVLMPASVADGAYGYTMLAGLPRQDYDYDEITCVAEFVGQRSPVYPEVASRIEILNLDHADVNDNGNSATALGSTILILFVAFIPLNT